MVFHLPFRSLLCLDSSCVSYLLCRCCSLEGAIPAAAVWGGLYARGGVRRPLRRCLRLDGQSVHPRLQLHCQQRVDHAVPLHRSLPFECCRYHQHFEVSLSTLRHIMPKALVHHLEVCGGKLLLDFTANSSLDGTTAGAICRHHVQSFFGCCGCGVRYELNRAVLMRS